VRQRVRRQHKTQRGCEDAPANSAHEAFGHFDDLP
jgi:hypothetical protein